MKTATYNDTKETNQSWEAWLIDLPDYMEYLAHLRGYGATEWEAKANLNDKINAFCQQVRDFDKMLTNGRCF